MTSASTENIGVRRALQIDAEHISDFNIAMALETEGKPLDSETVRGGVRAVLSRNDLGFYVVAEHRDETVGQLLITYEWSDWRNPFSGGFRASMSLLNIGTKGYTKLYMNMYLKPLAAKATFVGYGFMLIKTIKSPKGVYAPLWGCLRLITIL
ncbi:MAG: hypothetical protein Ct9H300mP11_00190 [Chloroflexota bacterium]|nr:MAG: hypothetical protein Ct9H300mP11_00190 [Chloroflexota bacterium]